MELSTVERHLVAALGEPTGRGSVTFLGAEKITVLRFGGRFVTLGLSAAPMADPRDTVADPVRGPRAELYCDLDPQPPADALLRMLAVCAAAPQVEGIVLAEGVSLTLGELWPGAPFEAVLLGAPGAIAELPLERPLDPVRFFPLLPMTPNEAALKRAKGAAAVHERWRARGTRLDDPHRAG